MLAATWGGIKAVPIRKLIGLLGLAVALFTAVCPPIFYAVHGYWKEQSALSFRAETTAARAANFIRTTSLDWQTDTSLLADATGIRGQVSRQLMQRVISKSGELLLLQGEMPSAPTTVAVAPVVVNGYTLGWAEAAGSLRPLFVEAFLLGLFTLGLAVAAYYAFTILPLRALDRSLNELERANARFKEQNRLFDAALSNMYQGLAMFDAEERLVFANERCAELYGIRKDQIRPGMTLREIAEQRVASGMYVGMSVDDVVESGRQLARSGKINRMTRKLSDGRTLAISVRPRDDGGWVTTYEDVTERERLNTLYAEQNERLREQERDLKRKNLLLDTALDTMSQGLAMFDRDQLLVICNRRYAEMYGLTLEQTTPGTSLKQIVEWRIANGFFISAGPEEYIRERTAPVLAASNIVHELKDGRWIAIARRPMPGGGWVTTHEDISEQRRREARIAHMAHHDALTDLPNRVLLNERLERALDFTGQGEIAACHLLDLDDFKNVNDTLGHPAGDKLLRQMAERLRSLVRDTDTIARMGGDEFAILQPRLGRLPDATALAQRVIDAVSEPFDIDGHQVVIGTSVGIAMGPLDGGSPDELIRNADLALYRAKGEGRGTYCFFEREMDGRVQARRAMECDLRKAQLAGEFELLYQPIVNLADNEISGLEALIRWRHPEKGTIQPSDFIPLAEETGLIEPISEWVLRQACTRAAKWSSDLKIAVNLSPAQFRRPGLVNTVMGALAASGLPADRLELEITENSLLQNTETTLETLYQLRELGVRIAMDDFGTGHSSLSYLQSFPFDKIKIDRSFVKDITDGLGSRNIVRAVTAMAQGLGMTTTAEGVETEEQLAAVRAEGCTEMQGFLFSCPLAVSQVDELLKKHRKLRTAGKSAAAA